MKSLYYFCFSGTKPFLYLLLLFSLAGCEPGSGASDDLPGVIFSVNAGPDITLVSGDSTEITAQVSMSDSQTIQRYEWRQDSSGLKLELVDSDRITVSFVAPAVTDTTRITLTLEVVDDQGNVASDVVNVTIRAPVNSPTPPAPAPPPPSGENTVPAANAGEDLQVAPGELVTIIGRGEDKDGAIVSYKWLKITGPAVDITGADTDNIRFTAPTRASLFFFRFIVIDNSGAQAYDDIVVRVNNNNPPIANAGGDITVASSEQVIITGSGDDPDGRILRYTWTQLPGGPVIAIANGNTATVNFTAPAVTSPTTITLRLSVMDDFGDSTWDDVVITVMPSLNNKPPSANAGVDKVANSGDSVTLAGTASDADGRIVSYLWSQDAGPVVTLSGANTRNVEFVMPEDMLVGAMVTLRLTVTDNSGESGFDRVTITLNAPPVANAGADQGVTFGDTVTLRGSASDSNGSVVSFMWKQLAGPTVTLRNANTNITSFAAPLINAAVTLQLSVTDNHGAIGSDTVIVTLAAAPTNTPPTANAGPDLIFNANEPVEITGIGLDSDGVISAYLWEQVAGPAVTLSGATTATVGFTAPSVNNSAVITLRLTVTDNAASSGVDEVNVSINAPLANALPTANAGADQTVNENDRVTLSGSGVDSDGSIVSYRWQQVAGPPVVIANPALPDTTFVAPAVTANTGITLQLTVTDDMGGSGSDELTIFVNSSNQVPVANAGQNVSVQSGDTVTIAGSGSDVDGIVVDYSWTQLSGPPVTLTGATTATVGFIAPSVMTATTITLRLTVTDDKGASANADVSVTVNGNLPPIANAGADFSVSAGATVTVNGSGTDPDGGVTQYVWTQIEGPAATFNTMTSPSIDIIAPSVTTDTAITLRLTVIDDQGATATDDIVITVQAGGNLPPAANAGLDQVVNSGETVSLAGSGTDTDGTVVDYAWQQMSGTNVVLSNVNGATATFTAPTVDVATELSFQLTVKDNVGDSHSDVVVISVFPLATLSGVISAAAGTLIDSDINDPNAPFAPNDDSASAQPISNPATIGGYVNQPAAGPFGRSSRGGDVNDVYVVTLANNQGILLNIGDVGSGGNDLDLYLLNAAGQEIDASLGRGTATESLLVPTAGTYLVRVTAFSGASNYILSIGLAPQAVQSNGWRLSDDFEPGDVMVTFRDVIGIAAVDKTLISRAASVGMQAKAGAPGRTMLLSIGEGVQKTAALRTLAIDQPISTSSQTLQLKLETMLAAKALANRGDVEEARLNYRYYPTAIPNDTNYNLQWHYPFINLPQAWDITTGSGDVIVAVIDTGVLLRHPDLQGQLVPGYDFIASNSNSGDGEPGIDANPDDPGDGSSVRSSSFHGTHVSGTIAAASNNGVGVAGVAWGVKIMPCRAIGINGGSGYDVEQCVRYSAGLPNDSGTVPAQRADIINLSLGGPANSTIAPSAYRLARNAGVIVVAAAGNDSSNQLFSPAAYEGVISVSATNLSRNLASYSNFGSTIDVSAPGGDSGDINLDGMFDGVLSTSGSDSNNNPISFNYQFAAGTSMSAPHMAGVVALMKSVFPGLTPALLDAMLVNGDLTEDLGLPGRDNSFGYGLIDAQKAVSTAANAGGTPPAPAAVLQVSPANISLGVGLSSAQFNVANTGGGALTVTNVSNNSGGWLSISPVAVDNNGLGAYQVRATRTGLLDGVYTANITITSSAGTQLVRVTMQVASIAGSSDAGPQYVELFNVTTSKLVDRIVVDGVSGNYRFVFPQIKLGTYRIRSGSDIDNDRVFCELGDSCGAFPTLDNTISQDISVDGSVSDLNGLDFSTGFSVNLGNP